MLDASFAHIASFPCLGLRKLRVELGESVMVAGMGILGVFALQFALLSGAIPVLVADLDPVRRDLALKLGATAAFDPSAKDFKDRVLAATGGRGVDGVVEVTAWQSLCSRRLSTSPTWAASRCWAAHAYRMRPSISISSFIVAA